MKINYNSMYYLDIGASFLEELDSNMPPRAVASKVELAEVQLQVWVQIRLKISVKNEDTCKCKDDDDVQTRMMNIKMMLKSYLNTRSKMFS